LVLRGIENLIERHCPTVLCEINPWFLEGYGIPLQELEGFFVDRDYGMYRYEMVGERRLLRPTAVEDVVEDNYLFVHPRRRDRFAPFYE
jgi:hypothetical protein